MLLQIANLTKCYKENIAALYDISCVFNSGIIAIIGPNAAGKTTLLRILAGLEDSTAGRITIDGLELTRNKQMLRSILGYLPQECGFYKKTTGEEMLDYIAVLKGIYDKKIRRYLVDEAIDMVSLNNDCKIKVGEYSFGMKRRLGIAQALLGKPPIIILDEPMDGLDAAEHNRLGGIIARLAVGRLVIFTTHSLSAIRFDCTALMVLRQGRMLYQGTASELAGLADGLVWKIEAGFQQVEQLKTVGRVVSLEQSERCMTVRVITPQKPMDKATLVKPRLEEGYLVLLNGGGLHI